MAKSIKLKVTESITHSLQVNTLIKGSVDKEGNITITKFCNAENKRKRLVLSVGISGEIFLSGVGGVVAATFIELKTKTIKCLSLDHKNPVKKSFKVGKRYQMESGRALGGVAGYVFDEDGCRWTLFREEVGFSIADGTVFEAKYS